MGYFKKTTMNRQIFVLVLLICASCRQSTDSKIPINNTSIKSTEVGQDKPIDRALIFLNSYVDNCNKMKGSIGVVEWVNANKLTTNNFRTELKRIMDEANKLEPEIGLDADPIFDAQDYPDKGFELDSFDSETNYIVVKGKNWPDFKLTIKMVSENDDWLVEGCGMINIPNDKRIAK
jgi:hypothetical protein